MDQQSLVSEPVKRLDASDYEFAHVWAEKIGMQIIYGNEEAAIDLVRLAMAERRKKREPAPAMKTPLAELLDARTANALDKHCNVLTVGELLELTPVRLMSIPNFGPTGVNTIYATLAAFAFRKLAEVA